MPERDMPVCAGGAEVDGGTEADVGYLGKAGGGVGGG